MSKLLVIDDTPAALDALTTALRPHFEVDTATSVADAAVALASSPHTYSAVVLDLVLDVDAAKLRDLLDARGTPVVLVSGHPERLAATAAEHGWSFLAKPFDPDSLVAAVERAIGRATPAPDRALPAPSRVPAPPAPAPARDQSTPPGAPVRGWPQAADAIVDKLTRRALRGGAAVLVYRLQSSGHGSTESIVALVALAVGVDAALSAWQRSRPAAAAAVALPVLLALAGEASGAPHLVDAGAYTAALGAVVASRLGS